MRCDGVNLWRADSGAGTVTTLALVAAVVTVTASVVLVASALITVSRAQSVVDDSALAAADSASGRIAGYPCTRAERLAGAAQILLSSCEIRGATARVTSMVTVLGFSLELRAQAGPPSE